MNPADEHRDPDVEAAWRAASREQPPPALDAAITAAARRAVGAGPKRLDAPRAWWPIAAAAVVAIVAIGIVEMTPPEEVAPTLMPAAPQPPAEPASQPPGRQDTMREQRAPAGAAAERALSDAAEAARKVRRASPPARAEPPTAASEALKAAPKPGNPFPGSPSDASEPPNAAAPSIDRFAAKPAPPQAQQQAAPSTAGAGAQQAPAPAANDSRQAAPAQAAGALASRSEPASSDKPQPLANRARDDEVKKQKDAQPRTVDEWIGLIRRLKAQGRNDLVAKELTAFRARYGERADALLPADLRDTKP